MDITQYIQPVWIAYTTCDDRGTLGSIIGVCNSKGLADTFAEKQGWYGGNGSVKTGKAIVVDGDVYLLMSDTALKLNHNKLKSVEQEIKEAKGKLITREKELLGIK